MLHRKTLGLVLGLALVTACDDDDGNGPAPREDAGMPGDEDAGTDAPDGGPESDCTPLELGSPAIYLNVFGQVNGVKYPVLTEIGDPSLPEYVLVELLDSTTETPDGFLPKLVTGEFDLATAPDTHVTTCQHCVSLVTDVTEGPGDFIPVFQPAGWYFQQQGTLSLSAVHDPVADNPIFAGELRKVELAEIDLDDPAQPVVTDGACYYVSTAEFDKRPRPGADCRGVEECGNELLAICDPATLKCLTESQCNIDQPCAEVTDFCIQQSPVSALGACYPRCAPFEASGCPDGRTCVQYGISERDGYCLTAGDGQVGEACEVKSATTSCAGDAVCWEGTCRAQCGFFSSAPPCEGAGVCDVLGHCMPGDAGRPVELGEACGEGAVQAQGCAEGDGRFDGICFSYSDTGPFTCEKACFVDADDYDGDADDGATDTDCAADQFCAFRYSSGLGICLPDPVCGDGERGEVVELCDDENTTGGDGCSADCKTVEYDVLCEAAPVLGPDDEVEGSTEGALDGFKASCQLGLARGRIYSLVPPGLGQLEITLSTSSQQVVSLRGACADDQSEVACGVLEVGQASGTLAYQITEESPEELTVLISANTLLEEGPFGLTTKFTPQVCGDGLTVGSEACDDGNDDAGDGCSADCLAIEYDHYCDNATVLTSGTKVSGDLAGAPQLFTPTCGWGPGPNRLYRFTASRAGTLEVSLDQLVGGVETDLALTLLDRCAFAPENELGCSSVVSPTEDLSIEVTAGQVVYIGVDGLWATAGKYELTATLR
jgi:cysteine-rich repeat protein